MTLEAVLVGQRVLLHTGLSRINGGFFVCEPSVFDHIEGDATMWEREPLERLAREGGIDADA
jgi:NDP-sugar pyrophosphorylase family protein